MNSLSTMEPTEAPRQGPGAFSSTYRSLGLTWVQGLGVGFKVLGVLGQGSGFWGLVGLVGLGVRVRVQGLGV